MTVAGRQPLPENSGRMSMARILLVDDEPIIHETVGRFLKRQMHDVFKAEDGEEALNILGQQHVDLLIADIRMPRVDGLSLLGQVAVQWPTLPVIMISGHGDQEMETKAFELGAVAFETKPLRLRDLAETVAAHLPPADEPSQP